MRKENLLPAAYLCCEIISHVPVVAMAYPSYPGDTSG